jgi:pilus assembly protein CpaB
MRRSTNLAILIVAIILGGLAAFLARTWLQGHVQRHDGSETISIVVAKSPLAFGSPLTPENVREVAWPAKAAPEGAFISYSALVKDGRRMVIAPFVRDEPIISSKVSAPGQRASLSTVIEEGKRAVTVAVDDVRGVAGFIFPGDFVDVVLTRTNNAADGRDFSEVILQHVKVLAIDQVAGDRQERPTVAKAVTLEVEPQQALKTLLAASIGKLSLILRQSDELALAPDTKVTDRELMGTEGDPPPASESPPPPIAAAPPPPVAAAPPPPPPEAGPEMRTVVIVRSVKSEQYQVPRDSQ